MGKDVHTEHCCLVHGCKYGDEDCTVVTKQKLQSYTCELCAETNTSIASENNLLTDLKHIINNPLTIILGTVENSDLSIVDKEIVSKAVRRITVYLDSLERNDLITGHFINFPKEETMKKPVKTTKKVAKKATKKVAKKK